mgnify:CR=1 FL=1
MRYLMITALALTFFIQEARAQEIEITPMVGYVARNDLRFIEGKMEVNDLLNFGASFSFPSSNDNGRFDFLLANSFTRAIWHESPDYADLISEKNYSMNVTYFQLSYTIQTEFQRDYFLYFGPSLGLVNYNISKSEVENMPRFSIGAQTGVKMHFNHMLGVRANCHMILPVFMGSGKHFRGITEETGVNSYLNVNATTFPVNFLFDVGLILRFPTRW